MPEKKILGKDEGFFNLTNEAYHRGPGAFAVSKSALVVCDISFRRYKYHLDHPEEVDIFDKTHMKFHRGTAVHTRLLEPHLYKKEVTVWRHPVKTGVLWDNFKTVAIEKNLTPIMESDQIIVDGIYESLHSGEYETARKILEHPDNFIEKSGFWKDPETGLWLKTRPDIINHLKVTWDVKTYNQATFKPTLEKWSDHAFNLKYHWQAAMALDGVTQITDIKHQYFGHIICETDPPYDIALFMFTDDAINIGRMEYQKVLWDYAECLKSGYWPGHPDEVLDLEAPHWARTKNLY